MKLFTAMQIREAYAHAKDGGQALHVFDPMVWGGSEKPPAPFARTMKQGKPWAHLFDQDKDRLVETARKLGVRVICVSREGTDRQHVDLCGKPLERAIAEAAGAEETLAKTPEQFALFMETETRT